MNLTDNERRALLMDSAQKLVNWIYDEKIAPSSLVKRTINRMKEIADGLDSENATS